MLDLSKYGIHISKITFKLKLPYTCTKEYTYNGVYDKANEARNNTMDDFMYVLSEQNIKYDRPYYKINLWYSGYYVQVSNEYVKFHNIDYNEMHNVIIGIEKILDFMFDDKILCNPHYICYIDYQRHYDLRLLKRLIGNGFEDNCIYRINNRLYTLYSTMIIKGRNCIMFERGDLNNYVYGYMFLYMKVIVPHMLLLGSDRSNLRFLVMDVIKVIIDFLSTLYDDEF